MFLQLKVASPTKGRVNAVAINMLTTFGAIKMNIAQVSHCAGTGWRK